MCDLQYEQKPLSCTLENNYSCPWNYPLEPSGRSVEFQVRVWWTNMLLLHRGRPTLLDMPKASGEEYTRNWILMCAKLSRLFLLGWVIVTLLHSVVSNIVGGTILSWPAMSCLFASEWKTNSYKPTTSFQTDSKTRKWYVCTGNRWCELE